jgi:hypothetical protein
VTRSELFQNAESRANLGCASALGDGYRIGQSIMVSPDCIYVFPGAGRFTNGNRDASLPLLPGLGYELIHGAKRNQWRNSFLVQRRHIALR